MYQENNDLGFGDYVSIMLNWKKRCNRCGGKVKLTGETVPIDKSDDYVVKGFRKYRLSDYFKKIYLLRYECRACNKKIKPSDLLWL